MFNSFGSFVITIFRLLLPFGCSFCRLNEDRPVVTSEQWSLSPQTRSGFRGDAGCCPLSDFFHPPAIIMRSFAYRPGFFFFVLGLPHIPRHATPPPLFRELPPSSTPQCSSGHVTDVRTPCRPLSSCFFKKPSNVFITAVLSPIMLSPSSDVVWCVFLGWF